MALETAPWPFNANTESDFILVTSDSIYFYVHKLLLSIVSPVFKSMFMLPPDESQEVYDGRPCVKLADMSKSLLLLLSWCDPRCLTRSADLNDLQLVLELADKYGMDIVMKHVESSMIGMKDTISARPVVMYAIATRFRLENLAHAAAKVTLKAAFEELATTLIPETRYITGLCFISLLRYHRACATEAADAAKNFDWLKRDNQDVSFFTFSCPRGNCCPTTDRGNQVWKSWWLKYMDAVALLLAAAPYSSVSDIDLIANFNTEISKGSCQPCCQAGHKKLAVFAKKLSKEVKTRISSVKDNS
jgi:hypothetical protein